MRRKHTEPVVLRPTRSLAARAAERIVADPDLLAAYEVATLPCPPEVEVEVERLLNRKPRRDAVAADDVSVIAP